MEFIFDVNKDRIRLNGKKEAVSGNANSYICRFIFSEEYENLEAFAVFECKGEFYTVNINENFCIVPYEAIESENIIRVGVFASGEKDEGFIRISTNNIGINVETGAYSIYSVPKTPDIWESYILEVRNEREMAENAAKEAQTSYENALASELKATENKEKSEEYAQKAQIMSENAAQSETVAEQAYQSAQNKATEASVWAENANQEYIRAKGAADLAEAARQSAEEQRVSAENAAKTAADSTVEKIYENIQIALLEQRGEIVSDVLAALPDGDEVSY